MLLGEVGISCDVVGKDGEDPGRRLGRLGSQLGEFGVRGIVGEIFPFLRGVRAQRGRKAAFRSRLVAPATGPSGHPDFHEAGDVFNHGVWTHVMRVFQPCRKQQGVWPGREACLLNCDRSRW
ncbi:hypothetical protein D9M72_643190 [compost metagenome]